MNGWYFRPKIAGETHREPIHGEFFSTYTISDPGVALVREGIQNSLDAGRGDEKITVRIYLSDQNEHLTADKVAPYIEGAWEHLRASENGLLSDEIPSQEEPCPFLVFEDFGTGGLEGDPAEANRNKSGRKNHFYHFFRAEGQSDKEASDRGSWGIGKQVFPRSSRISGVFGVTVRADDKQQLLMGRLILKSHYVGNDYCQDGYFGVIPDGHHFVLPIDDASEIQTFCELFDLQRGSDPGLSLVVLWPDPEISDQTLLKVVLSDYFYPILTGELDVFVETPTVKIILDSNSLIPEAKKLGDQVTSECLSLLELADWAWQVPKDEKTVLNMPDPDHAWRWLDGLIEPEQMKSLREALHKGDRFAVRVAVTVRTKGGAAESSFFDVYLVRDETNEAGRPTFIREGVIISKVDSPRTRGVRAIVVADDLPLTAFLRDAENPSHTEWQHDGSNFRGKYKSGRADLTFVKRSVHEIVRTLTEQDKQEDRSLLIDLFSLPAPRDEEHAVKTRRTKTQTPPPKPRRFRVQKARGGFSVVPGDDGAGPPSLLDIRVAYDIRRGNPLKKYNIADFRLDKKPVRFDPEPQGVDILERSENRMLVAVTDPNFSLHVTGFDERRDLYVRAVSKEKADGNSAT